MSLLGLPEAIVACLFDLDGVLTRTASVHRAAWKQTFDEVLRRHANRTGVPFVPFDPRSDYAAYVDGKQRADGVRDFLASRGLVLAEGTPSDNPDADTVHGVGSRKNEALLQRIAAEGVEVYEGSRSYVNQALSAGLRTAVVSASANTQHVLAVTGLVELFEVCVDGVVARRQALPGKPAPDTYLYAARQLGVQPRHAAVFEDALAGVAAGHAGGFGLVVGVDRLDHAAALREHGADIIVGDLGELL